MCTPALHRRSSMSFASRRTASCPGRAVAGLLLAAALLPWAAARSDDLAGPLQAVDAARVLPAEVASRSPGDWLELLGGRPLETLIPSAVMFGVISLAPAVLLMTTCFVRMSVVLSLLRQGLGMPQIPSNQIVASLAIFLSAMVMWPVWNQAWRDGMEPYRSGTLSAAEAFDKGSLPIRRWMAGQIEQAGNRDTMLLETAFTIGFRMLLPFLVLDILVATLVVATGLVMLPPSLVSLPLKLLVFVAADGWSLVVRSLLDSVRALPS